jgi:hypothetical protein
MKDRTLLEAQFYWAFACLVLAGRRGPDEFHAEMMRRSCGAYPDAAEVESTVEEALRHLPTVLNQALTSKHRAPRPLTGWERHVLALSGRPVERTLEVVENALRRKKA